MAAVQGSSIGPASYVVNTRDLQAVTPGSQMIKFADDFITRCLVEAAEY